MIVKPFRGWRPRADLASRIPSPPYDVLDADEARRLAAAEPDSFVHVIRPEADLDPAIDPHAPAVYARAAANFRALIDDGRLVRDERPAFYVYRLSQDEHRQTGLVAAAAVADYLEGRIKRHEHTRPDKLEDRIELNDAISAHPGPVFLAYRSLPELNATVSGVVAGEPAVDFEAPDAVRHELWVVDEPATVARIESLFGSVRATYVADGHHRAEAAARVAERRLARVPDTGPGAPCRFFLAVHFPAEQLRVLDYNRTVADLNGLDVEAFLERLRRAGFHVKPRHRGRRPPGPETFGMYLAGGWYLLTPRPDLVPRDDVVRRLDVSVLTERILQPILGVGDVRTDRRIDFVGGGRGIEELERRVDSRRAEVAFAVHPVPLDDVMAVADAGGVMPPKSTWFEPKLRSGMVVQSIEGEEL